jgi:hypothetical protein
MQEAARDHEFLFHAARKFGWEFVCFIGDLEFFEQAAAERFVIAHVVDARGEGEVLIDGEVIEQARFVGEKCEPLFRFNWIFHHVETANAHGAARWRNDPGKTAERGSFARAVWADQADNFAGSHIEREVSDCGEVTVDFRQCLDGHKRVFDRRDLG